ncbi:MAG: PAS domain S-box protein [Minwuia sp.]|uniref:sensor histidine kinase n=1 Tax=Minwuia sp. TaxID=2493630 RepID=UPI003A8BB53C
MLERISEFLLSVGGYTPHGYCLAWNPPVLYTHIVSDLLIFASYTAIPVAMLVFWRKRTDLGQFKPALALFFTFILFCGLTHLVAVITLWYPVYGLQGAVKAVTAVVSLGTAIVVWPLLPKLLAIPAPSELETVNASLRTEIEQRRHAEEQLRVALDERENEIRRRTADLAISEARFRAFAAVSADWFWETDADGLVTHVSEKLGELTGIPQEEWISSNPISVLSKLSDPETTLAFKGLVSRREQFRGFGIWADFPTGRRHFTISGEPVYAIDGAFKGYRGVGADTTEREESQQRIARLNERFRLSIEAAPNAMIMVDSLGRIAMVNRQAELMFGYVREEMLGNSVHMLLPERLREKHRRLMSQYMAKPEQRSMGLNSELTCRHHSGREIPVEIGLNPVVADDGDYVIASIIDMSEHRRANEEIRQAREAAERASRAKSAFLANMSHELRTPLNAILGFSEALKVNMFGPVGSDKNQEYVDDIHSAAGHLKSLISNVLDLSRIEAGKEAVDLSVFDVAEAIDDCITMVGGLAQRRDIRVVDLAVRGTEVCVDRRHLLQVLINVTGNAIKYSNPGGTVELSLDTLGDEIAVIQISDDGPGIPPEDISRALSAFERLGGIYEADNGGTGLGLPISVQLMEMNGGSLELVSEPGKGTTVSLSMPVAGEGDQQKSGTIVDFPDLRC